jgi:membrane-associated phospholipid phosphatase
MGDGGAALALGVLWLVPAAFMSPASMQGSYTQPNDPGGLWAIDKVAVGPRNMAVSQTSDVIVGGLLAGGAAYAGLALADPDRRGRGAAVVESVLLTGAVVEWLKVGVGRDRPYTYDSLDGIGEDFAHRSFPSGHTAMAVATATSLTVGWARSGFLDSDGGKWATAGVWTAAVTTASLRVVSSSHFPTDVLTSSAIAVGCTLLVEGMREWTAGN